MVCFESYRVGNQGILANKSYDLEESCIKGIVWELRGHEREQSIRDTPFESKQIVYIDVCNHVFCSGLSFRYF